MTTYYAVERNLKRAHRRPDRNTWFVADQQGEPTLFVSCRRCDLIIALAKDYRVHPVGFVEPCLKCPGCNDEGWRFLASWKPIQHFTHQWNWKNRRQLLRHSYHDTIFIHESCNYLSIDDFVRSRKTLMAKKKRMRKQNENARRLRRRRR